MLEIKTNNDTIYFLQWLVCIKKYEALDIIRVLEKPKDVSELYRKYTDESPR